MFSDLLARCGKGWPGSTASGVSTGKICARNISCTNLRCSGVRSFSPRKTMRCSRRAGLTSSSQQRYCASTSSATTSRMRSRFSRGRILSPIEPRLLPPRTFCCSPPTRTMKNSSRFELKIARNLTRSSSGTVGSRASSRTRRLNWSQLSSRLRYSDGSSRAMVIHVPYQQDAMRRVGARSLHAIRRGILSDGSGGSGGVEQSLLLREQQGASPGIDFTK